MLGRTLRQLTSWLRASRRDGATKDSEQRILIVHNTDDEYAAGFHENAATCLRYCRLPFDSWDITNRADEPSLHRYSCILLCTEFLQVLDARTVERLRDYVRRGGGLGVVYRGWNPDLRELLGVEQAVDWPEFVVENDVGIEFMTDAFDGFEGLCLSTDEISGHVPYDMVPMQDATVLARNAGGRPLAWLRAEGAGRVLYWNSTILAEPMTRGLLVQTIACVQSKAVLPIANVGLIQVDDFPPPPLDALPEPAATEFPGATADHYYYDIWHRDMLNEAAAFGITYSYFAVLDYTDSEHVAADTATIDTSTISDDLPEFFNAAAAEMAMQSGELGFHGHSHRPLLIEHWGSADAMRDALARARRIWLRWQGRAPSSFVPPNNEYDRPGAEALAATFPELEAICGTYLQGDFERGGNREFGPEPWAQQLYAVPRATSGYELTSIGHFEMASQVATFGVWTHFVHPDDVFDTPEANPEAGGWRNPQSRFWRAPGDDGKVGLLTQFSAWLGLVDARYPWLRYMDTRSAVRVLKAYFDSRFHIRFGIDRVRVDAHPGAFFHVRVNDASRINPVGIRNAWLIGAVEREGYALYTFEASNAEVEIEFV